jgi:hypothetical protein
MTEPPPIPSDQEAIALVRAAAAKGLSASRRAQRDVVDADYDFEDAEGLIAKCSLDAMHRVELDDKYPARQFYVVILKMDVPNHTVPFYVKVGLVLPGMTAGRLISFHPWGMHDRSTR